MSAAYRFALESFRETYPEFEPIYRQHYGEMQARLAAAGITIEPFNLRLDQYFRAADEGWFLHFTARTEGQPVGYCNVYVTQDMHNGALIGQEDALYVLPEHRNGIGRRLVLFAGGDLRRRGLKRMHVTVTTDPRVAALWKRIGAREAGMTMIYQF